MKDQLKLLEELQRHDARIQELEGARKTIPAKLEEMRLDLSRLEDILGRERTELEEAEKWRRDKDGEMKMEESQLAKSKQKLAAVKNSKEYMASQREMETVRKMVAETEEKLTSVIAAEESARGKIAIHEVDVEKLRKVVRGEEEMARTRLATIEEDLSQAKAGRDAASKAVRADVLKKYSAIKMRRGLAVVAVHGGTCRGCNMNIPPQLYNQLQRGNSIEMCPNCHRIVYWDKLLENPDGKPSEPAEKPA